MAKAKTNNNTKEPIEKQLWKAADKLRKNIDAAEYKHIVMGQFSRLVPFLPTARTAVRTTAVTFSIPGSIFDLEPGIPPLPVDG